MKQTELECFADRLATDVFTPLYLNDLFILNRLKDNPNAYNAFIDELLVKWHVPDEDALPKKGEIMVYDCPEIEDLPKPEDNTGVNL